MPCNDKNEIQKAEQHRYDFQNIENKWQSIWEETELFLAPDKPDPDNKFYMLVMFAYPSGDIHMGHFRNYIIGDAVARRQMMLGKAVLHPFGWDAFGLPAERAAIQRNIHPEEWTLSNTGASKKTLQRVGISFDWSREINSCLPDYYRWTQWMFIKMFERGLAYKKTGFVNWCPEDKTVLANEQVKDGKCERCDTVVIKKEQSGWYFKITDYAQRLLDDLDTLDGWPDNLKAIQRDWIGRSEGCEVDFIVEETGEKLPIYTTRPDTIYGVTYMAISPEAELLNRLDLDDEHRAKVEEYRKLAFSRSEIERSAVNREKDGVFTGKYIVNPFNNQKVELWVADYVLAGYGTGAVMAVPAHDERDFSFAKQYDLPIRVVIHPNSEVKLEVNEMDDAFTDYGLMVNSGSFNGLIGREAVRAVTDYAEKQGIGRRKVNFKLRDWSISRQRYWGTPIPIIHCPKCGPVAVAEDQLPVKLPMINDFIPKGKSPLASDAEFMATTCPKCGGEASRDPDTMDTFCCSSWYLFRYLDAHNESAPFDKEKAAAWMPVDLYIGGITHATGHLIYFRFFNKFLKDIGWLKDEEPALNMFNHGMVSDSSGEIMSKSKGNVVSPMELIDHHGADVTRLAMFFTAPSEREVLWSNEGITGVEKFATRKLFGLNEQFRDSSPDLKQYFNLDDLSDYERSIYVKLNQTVAKVSDSFDRLQFNTAIAALMELVRDFSPAKVKNDQLSDYIILKTIQMAAPLIPHMAEEMWQACGFNSSVFKSSWPVHDPSATVQDMINIAVQINGKLRGTVEVASDADQGVIEAAADANEKVKAHLAGKTIVKKIYVPGRLLNIVVKP